MAGTGRGHCHSYRGAAVPGVDLFFRGGGESCHSMFNQLNMHGCWKCLIVRMCSRLQETLPSVPRSSPPYGWKESWQLAGRPGKRRPPAGRPPRAWRETGLEIIPFAEPLAVGDELVFDDMAHYTMVKHYVFQWRAPSGHRRSEKRRSWETVRRFSYEDFEARLG